MAYIASCLRYDIEAGAEQKMLSRYWRHLTATLPVPHHGSNNVVVVTIYSART